MIITLVNICNWLRDASRVTTSEAKPKGKGKGTGKAIPLQAWTGPEVYRRLRLLDMTVGT